MNSLKKTIYSVADVVTLGRGIPRKIGGSWIRFPPRWSRYYESSYEPETFRFLSNNLSPGSVFLDIGAHIGLFSVVSSRIVGTDGRVFAFEPTPFTRGVLKDVLALNGCKSNVTVCRQAVSKEKGTISFFETGDVVSNANSLVETDRSKAEIEVEVTTVDDFATEKQLKIDCIKIDVEGAELDLLKGAQDTLLTDRPAVRLGLHPESLASHGQSLEEVWDLLKSLGADVEIGGSRIQKGRFCSQETLFDVNISFGNRP